MAVQSALAATKCPYYLQSQLVIFSALELDGSFLQDDLEGLDAGIRKTGMIGA
jgi:hypothetical protein